MALFRDPRISFDPGITFVSYLYEFFTVLFDFFESNAAAEG